MRYFEIVWTWWSGSTVRDRLLVAIGTLAICWYFVAILCIGCTDVNADEEKGVKVAGLKSPEMRQFMSVSITTISGTLATYLGLVLGVSQVREARANAPDMPRISKLQATAAWTYVLSLIVALIIWAVRSQTTVDAVIVNLARSILGLFGGVLAVILNVKPNQ